MTTVTAGTGVDAKQGTSLSPLAPARTPIPLEILSNPVPQFVSEEHRQIFELTKNIPGWQVDGDAFKLFELGFHAGDVILELGVYGGRSAVVELRGALANPERRQPPQFFGLDLDPEAIKRSWQTLRDFGLDAYALLFQGNIAAFVEEFAIQPTMVFVDADHEYAGVRSDLDALSRLLAPGVPVLCHDYTNPENDTGELGVRRAVTEWIEAGKAALLGIFGCSALLVTTEKCEGPRLRMTDAAFARHREQQLARHGVPASVGQPQPPAPDWQGRAEALERELSGVYASKAYRVGRALARVVGRGRRLLGV
jgi:hypothetical protein